MAVLVYLSTKYAFLGGYFRGMGNQIDRGLAAGQYCFITLAAVSGVSVVLRAQNLFQRLLGGVGLLLPFILVMGLRSRTGMLQLLITATICWITIRPRQTATVLLSAMVVGVSLFTLGSAVKLGNVMGDSNSFWDNLRLAQNVNTEILAQVNDKLVRSDVSYRLAGFELPAAILSCLESGKAPMYGRGLYQGLVQGLPSMLRDDLKDAVVTERSAISEHYIPAGLRYDDSIGIPITSGLADWGVLGGPLIYVPMALACLALWLIIQQSPRLFVAYLMSVFVVGDLFWDNIFFSVRAIGFAWMTLVLLGPLLMPQWKPARRIAACRIGSRLLSKGHRPNLSRRQKPRHAGSSKNPALSPSATARSSAFRKASLE